MKALMILGLALVTVSSAWAQSSADTSKEIDAQTTIISGGIDNLLDKMNESKTDARFNAEDYLAQSQEYKLKMELRLGQFEEALKKDILGKASFLMDQYNTIYRSPDYSEEQKRVLLAQRKINIIKQFELISKDYQQVLKNVYLLVPFADHSTAEFKTFPEKGSYKNNRKMKETIKVDYFFGSKKMSTSYEASLEKRPDAKYRIAVFVIGSKVTRVDPYNNYTYGLSFYTDYTDFNFSYLNKEIGIEKSLTDKMYKEYLYPAFKGSCKTISCIGLRTGDFTKMLIMIKNMFDRDMDLSLADGTKLQIKGLHHDITLISQELGRFEYPEELPFDL